MRVVVLLLLQQVMALQLILTTREPHCIYVTPLRAGGKVNISYVVTGVNEDQVSFVVGSLLSHKVFRPSKGTRFCEKRPMSRTPPTRSGQGAKSRSHSAGPSWTASRRKSTSSFSKRPWPWRKKPAQTAWRESSKELTDCRSSSTLSRITS